MFTLKSFSLHKQFFLEHKKYALPWAQVALPAMILDSPFLQETCMEAAVIQNYRKLSDLQVTNVLSFNSCPFFRSGPWLLPPSYLCVFMRARWGMSSPHPHSDPGPGPAPRTLSRRCPLGAVLEEPAPHSPAPWMPSAVVFSLFPKTTGPGDR